MYNMSMNDQQIAQLEIVKTKVRQLLGAVILRGMLMIMSSE